MSNYLLLLKINTISNVRVWILYLIIWKWFQIISAFLCLLKFIFPSSVIELLFFFLHPRTISFQCPPMISYFPDCLENRKDMFLLLSYENVKREFPPVADGKEEFQTFTVWGSIDVCFPLFKGEKNHITTITNEQTKKRKPHKQKNFVMSISLAALLRDMTQAEVIWSYNLTPVISFSYYCCMGESLDFST